MCLPGDRWAFLPAYLFGLGDGFGGAVDVAAGLRGLLTHMAVHDGPAHLFANVAALALVGAAVERRCGACTLSALFITAGVFAAVIEGLTAPDRLTALVGASGGVSGLMGMLAVIAPRIRLQWRPRIGRRGVSFPLIWLILIDVVANLALAALSLSEFAPLTETTAWRAHLAGAGFGAAVGVFYRHRLIVAADDYVAVTHGFAAAAGAWGNLLTACVWAAAVAAALRTCG